VFLQGIGSVSAAAVWSPPAGARCPPPTIPVIDGQAGDVVLGPVRQVVEI